MWTGPAKTTPPRSWTRRAVARFVVAATAVGLREMLRLLAAAGVGEVAIERPAAASAPALLTRPGPDLVIG